MGYSTDFFGRWELNKPLTDEQANYINKLANTRRMKRDVKKLNELYKGEHGLVGVPKTASAEQIYGVDGEFFVGGGGFAGQGSDESIVDYNTPPGIRPYNDRHRLGYHLTEDKKKYVKDSFQPSLWCQWNIVDNKYVEWDGKEKFYFYIEWIKYYIDNFFKPWGVLLNGEVGWQGEDREDIGTIIITDNEVIHPTA